jgi:hypothetical protein
LENSVGSLPIHLSELGPEELVGGKGLSAAVDRSALPLAAALGYAIGVAAALRERHGEKPAQTNGRPERVPAGPLGPVPHPSERASPQAEQGSDIVAFGALLYELMTGSRPLQDVSQFVRKRVPLVGPDGVRTAATCLAVRCMAGDSQDMQRILTELRLYSVIARQRSWRPTDSVKVASGDPSHITPPVNLLSEVSKGGPSVPQHPPDLLVSADQTQLLPYCVGQCPACGNSLIHRSRPRTCFENLLVATGISLKRCDRCLYRYVVILGIVFTKRPRHLRRHSREGSHAVPG